jgi:murein L,D-transpeptidase YcbB/YkuD
MPSCLFRLILFVNLLGLHANAQLSGITFKEFLSLQKKSPSTKQMDTATDPLCFYNKLAFQKAWITAENAVHLQTLLQYFRQSANWGLVEKDYDLPWMEQLRNHEISFNSLDDSMMADLRLTENAIHFFSDIALGNTCPEFEYTGLTLTPEGINIAWLLAEAIQDNKLSVLAESLSPAFTGIKSIEDEIARLIEFQNKHLVNNTEIISSTISWSNKPLITKLAQYNIFDSAYNTLPDSVLIEKINRGQYILNQPTERRISTRLIEALNCPVEERLQELNLALNYYRWLNHISTKLPIIVVNIPAAGLKVYCNKKVILSMKVIVGKKKTPTHTITSEINNIILYPYWHIPHSIATKELLPLIKKNLSYLDQGNYQVLDINGRLTDPRSINWATLNAQYFPYALRQGTGCDNSLGLLKLDFFNPFGAYLHDTPFKTLFPLPQRFFSHGCVRMEKPLELGHLILPENTIAIDTISEENCLKNKAPVVIPVAHPTPVIIWYNPIELDSQGQLIYLPDIYNKHPWLKLD